MEENSREKSQNWSESPPGAGRMRLLCDYFLILGRKDQALANYDRMLKKNTDPFLLAAKAKLLDALGERAQASEIFARALHLASVREGAVEEIAGAIAEVEESGGILRGMAQTTAGQKTVVLEEDTRAGAVEDAAKTEIVSGAAADRPTVRADVRRVDAESFGRYRILEKLGEGGMGTVYKAFDPEMTRTVALKVVKGEVASLGLEQRFVQEVKATARLRHPNIVAIYDFGDTPQHYFTMEYVSGKPLAEAIREGIFKSKKAAQVLKCVSEAIACAHQAKIIHRDLKPGNIMLDEKNEVKVMDFGLAKFLEGDSNFSRSGDIIGTPAYMSPEQAAGKAVDERSDIYAIGAIGYEMITGKPAFAGESMLNILQRVAAEDPLRPRAINAGIDADLETIVLKCLEKSPAKRYPNALALSQDLERYVTNRPIMARPPTLRARFGKWLRRNKELSVAAAVVVVSILGLFAYITHQWREQVKHNQALNIIREVMQWDKMLVSYEEVKPEFEKAERLSPRDVIYQKWGLFCFQYAHAQLNKSGECYKHLDERDRYYREALDKFAKAYALNPDDYPSLYYMLFIYNAWQDTEKAQQYEERLTAIVKRLETESGLKYQTLGVEALNHSYTLDRDGRKAMQEEALRYLLKAIRYDPELPCSHNGLSFIYRERGEYDLARQHAERCLTLTPTYRYAYVNQGRLYTQWGSERLQRGDTAGAASDFAVARRSFEQVLALDPSGKVYYKLVSVADVYYELSRICSLQQDREKALENLRQAIGRGFCDAARIEADDAFASVKNTREYEELLASLKGNKR